jgi:hypothetical protein
VPEQHRSGRALVDRVLHSGGIVLEAPPVQRRDGDPCAATLERRPERIHVSGLMEQPMDQDDLERRHGLQ